MCVQQRKRAARPSSPALHLAVGRVARRLEAKRRVALVSCEHRADIELAINDANRPAHARA